MDMKKIKRIEKLNINVSKKKSQNIKRKGDTLYGAGNFYYSRNNYKFIVSFIKEILVKYYFNFLLLYLTLSHIKK